MIATFGNQLHESAICLTTPVPKLVPLSKVEPPPSLREFLSRYEQRVSTSGLYSHQADVVKALKKRAIPNIVMTTATGSGKSLAFWAWAFEHMARNDEATLVATFPTQALLWGQAKRLADMSAPESLVEFEGMDSVCFAGTIEVGDTSIPWSVWYGTSECEYMKKHAQSHAFTSARLRLSTLDKVHWSLMRENDADFLSHLAGIVLDEAHSWHGLSGANVRAMFDRLRLSMDMLKCPHPSFFLASATLADATRFAASLTGAAASSFLEVHDKGASKAALVPTKDVPVLLSQPAEPGLLRRYVFLVEPEPEPLAARDVLGKSDVLGPDANALCFVQSKFVGHRLRQELHRSLPSRNVVAYDGDLPAKERRKVEDELFNEDLKPKVIVGTSALELGVDLPTLDVVVMDELPPRRCELLQRLGRVGRSAERPGLAVLCLGYSPGDERLIQEPLTTVAVDDIKPLSLPLHLDVVRLRAMSAVFEEWRWRLRKKKVSWDDFNEALERYFQWAPHIDDLKEHLDEVLGDVVDLDEGAWHYKGFRVSASQGKRKLILESDRKTIVATIEDIAVFRDAHPEGVYLGHRGASYRIKRYVGDWDVGTWKSPGGVLLGKYMKGLKHIEVCEEKPTVATRGRWKDAFKLEERKHLPDGHDRPAQGTLTFGIFTFLRQFDGYLQIDLRARKPPKPVSLAEVARRFDSAVEDGKSFPFLHHFSYRTKGWKWLITRVLDENTRKTLASVLGPLLQGFFCDVVECAKNDLQVTLDSKNGEIRVVDGTPGGNGLSEALLTEGRVSAAWAASIKQIRSQRRRAEHVFRRYLAEECRIDSDVTAAEVVNAIELLAGAWNG
ncbi:helicase-related protein [Myxococcus faecalis]|uniref:helicase-related protein n=1 Tax=Myxococcus faecalis TaxID=3115646 RepID=UPI003CF1DF92